MELYHGRGGRGKETGLCCVNRGNQAPLFMLAMVATMAVVLVWEASPFAGSSSVQSPILVDVPRSEDSLETPPEVYESRPFLKSTPPLPNKDVEEDSGTLTRGDAAPEIVEETKLAENESITGEDESLAPSSNGASLVESEETSLAEKEIGMVEKASESSWEDPVTVPNATNRSSAIADGETGAFSRSESSTHRREYSSGKCDYTVGKWVLDETQTRPFYSGLECKMWLSAPFSCRLHNHPDKLLDRYRWQPAGCDLPAFHAPTLLETLRNRVVAFVGDSLGRQQLQSLLCMLTHGKNETSVTDIGTAFGFYIPKGGWKPNGFAYRFDETNTTIIFRWSVTLARVQPLDEADPLSRNALHIDRPEEFLEDKIDQLDVVVLNTGHHWNGGKMKENRYDFYRDGKPCPIRVPIAYNTTVHNVVRWIGERTKNTGKHVFYRSLSPRHFRNGDWNTGGTCDTIRFENDKQVQEGSSIDPNAESAVRGTTVNLLNITSLSLERGETHVSKYGGGTGGQDCLHWCLPGVPDTWNEILYAELLSKYKASGSSSPSEQQEL